MPPNQQKPFKSNLVSARLENFGNPDTSSWEIDVFSF